MCVNDIKSRYQVKLKNFRPNQYLKRLPKKIVMHRFTAKIKISISGKVKWSQRTVLGRNANYDPKKQHENSHFLTSLSFTQDVKMAVKKS